MLFHYFSNLGRTTPLMVLDKLSKLHSHLDSVYAIVYHGFKIGGTMSETTTTRNFRQNLKQFFDIAQSEPIAINRGNERFVLLHESEFNKMKDEIMYLQKSLIASLEDLNSGGPKEMGDIEKFHSDLLDEIEEEDQEVVIQEKKKAVG